MLPHRTLREYFDAGIESQRSFAARLAISPSHLCRIVAGDKLPSLPVAVRIAEAAGIPVESLLASSHEKPTAAA